VKIIIKVVFALLFVTVMLFSVAPRYASATAGALVTQINAIDVGLSATYAGDIITVIGTTVTDIKTPLVLNIDSNITVNWQAAYNGTISPASSSMITINGSGEFNIIGAGSINNAGTGNTLNIAGAGTTVNISDGGSV